MNNYLKFNYKINHIIFFFQVVCDHNNIITYCYAGQPGSLHDQRVFRLSEMAEHIRDDRKFPGNSHLIGDAAYELDNRVMTPFRDNGHLTDRQTNFNKCLSSSRMCVERCFGLLKGRMRSLLDTLPMYKVPLMAEYIVACCVIHNVCTMRGDINYIEEAPPEEDMNPPIVLPLPPNVARDKRNHIMNNLRIRLD